MGTCAALCKRDVNEKPVEVIPVDEAAGVMGYPMWVVSLENFLEMSGPPRGHQELRREGVLVEHRPGMIVLFVSHQWLSYSHPDPDGSQLVELRRALRAVKAGELKPTSEWTMEMMFPLSARLTPEELGESTFVWYDYWSVPQPSLAEPGQEAVTAKQMINAVHTIPRYVRESRHFIILCPDLVHLDTGEVCNFRSWHKRGWCRLEMTSQGLRGPQNTTMAVQVRSGSHMSFLPAVSWSVAPVATGSFSVEEDREMLCPVVNALMDHFVNQPHLPEDTHGIVKRRWVLTQRSNLLTGFAGICSLAGRTPTPQTYVLESPEEEIDSFLRRYKFNTLLDRGEAAFGPIHCAACEQRCRVIEAAVRAGADVNAAASEDVPDITLCKGMTPLGLASFRGHSETVRCLLGLRADALHNQSGWTALHLAAMGGSLLREDHRQVIDDLLECRADVDESSAMGATALQLATYGTEVCVVEHLLARGADINLMSSMGGPLHHLSHTGWGAPEFVEVLVRGRADINAQVQPQSVGWQLLMGASRLVPTSSSMLCELMKNIEGATPLALAALMGHEDLCDSLLQARADPLVENRMRRSALDLVTTSGSRKSVLQKQF